MRRFLLVFVDMNELPIDVSIGGDDKDNHKCSFFGTFEIGVIGFFKSYIDSVSQDQQNEDLENQYATFYWKAI